MDRRPLQRVALVGGALVLIGGAVLVLRVPEPARTDAEEPAPPPIQQTTVAAFADPAVIVPEPGPLPAPPEALTLRATDRRLVAAWPESEGAAGYEVRWGEAGGSNRRSRLVAQPPVQLDGLRNDARYWVSVRAISLSGQRSRPARAMGVPSPEADTTSYTFLDRFDGDAVPDPARWRLVGIGNCTKASRGEGEDARRLVITGQCGESNDAVALRSRTPLRLRDPANVPDGELGRFVVQTDRPGQSGELTLDLVPGPAGLIGRPPAEDPPPGEPGRAGVDESLPPGTIRVLISGRPTESTVRVQVAPGTPLLGRPVAVNPVPLPVIWVSARWEVVLRTDSVVVLRDGVVVGGGDVVPSFTEATALIGLTGGQGGLRAALDLVGFTGAPVATPPLLAGPAVDVDRTVFPHGSMRTSAAGAPLPGVRAGLLRITLVPQRVQTPPGQFTVDIGGQEFPLRPAIPGQPVLDGVRLPVVADIPASALLLGTNATAIPAVVRTTAIEDGLPTQVLTAELELSGDAPATPKSSPPGRPLQRPRPVLAVPEAVLLDAGGEPVPVLRDMPRGRLVLEVRMDAVAAQRFGGEVAGLAGVEISMDGRKLAGIPTVTDGPGVGGWWRIGLNTVEFAPGGHTIQVQAVGVDPNTDFAISYTSFSVR